MECIFCKIINKEASADIVYEDDKVIAFKDIKPKAPIHLLIVPKKHINSVNEINSEDKDLVGEIFLVAKKIAQDFGIKEIGYNLLINVGQGGGQEIPHLHIHLMGDKDKN